MPNHIRVVSQAEGVEGPETKAEASPKKADGQAAPAHASDPDTPPRREGAIGDDVH
jgi:hypothetical protein